MPEVVLVPGFTTIWEVNDPPPGKGGVILTVVGDERDPCRESIDLHWDSIGHLQLVKRGGAVVWDVSNQNDGNEGVIVLLGRILESAAAASSLGGAPSSSSSSSCQKQGPHASSSPCPTSLCGLPTCDTSAWNTRADQIALHFDGVGHLEAAEHCSQKRWDVKLREIDPAPPSTDTRLEDSKGVAVFLWKVVPQSSSSSSSSSCHPDQRAGCETTTVQEVLAHFDSAGHLVRLQARGPQEIRCGITTGCCESEDALPETLLVTITPDEAPARGVCLVARWDGCKWVGEFTTECAFFGEPTPVVYHHDVYIFCKFEVSIGSPPAKICAWYICISDDTHTYTAPLAVFGRCCPLDLQSDAIGLQSPPGEAPFPRFCRDSASPGLDCFGVVVSLRVDVTEVPCTIPCDDHVGCLEGQISSSP